MNRACTFAIGLSVACLVGITPDARAATITVGGIDGDYATIQDAIDAAADSGDVIEVAPGTYMETIDFLSKTLTVRSTDGAEATIIDGTGSGPTVVRFPYNPLTPGPVGTLEGFTITGGNATNGGGIFADTLDVNIDSCIITANSAVRGGAFFCGGTILTLTDCQVTGNQATAEGNAGYFVASAAGIFGTTFSSNVPGDSEVLGGSLFISGGSMILVVDSTMSDNEAGLGDGGFGGAIYLDGSATTPTVVGMNSDFLRNQARHGGAIYATGGHAVLDAGCLLDDNFASVDGGGIWAADQSSVEISGNTMLVNNTADNSGGAIMFQGGGSLTLESCHIDDNHAQLDGGALYLWNGSEAVFDGCEVRHNTAPRNGGALYCESAGSLTLRNGCLVEGNVAGASGGAIYCNISSPLVLESSVITGNSAAADGGAILLDRNGATMTASSLDGNWADSAGGGIAIYRLNVFSIAVSLTSCTMQANRTGSGFDGPGGAVWIQGGGSSSYENKRTITFDDCTFDSNTGSEGGAINAGDKVRLEFTGCEFTLNRADTAGGAVFRDNRGGSADVAIFTDCDFNGNSLVNLFTREGGAVYCIYDDSSSSFRTSWQSCTFFGNGAYFGSGIFNIDTGSRTKMERCSFIRNVAGTSGGIYNVNSDPVIADSVFAFNDGAPSGAGVYNDPASDPAITNCTFIGNEVGGFTGIGTGAAVYSDAGASPTITNCIMWANVAPTGNANIDGSGVATVTYSNIEGGWPGETNIDAAPMFVDLDGPDDVPGTLDDNLRLLSSSPCIDAGSNAGMWSGSILDRDGNGRVLDGDGDGTATVDMGAYEFDPTCQGDTNGDGFVDIDDIVNAVLDFNTDGSANGGDVDGNGVVDIDDIVLIVLSFGECPGL